MATALPTAKRMPKVARAKTTPKAAMARKAAPKKAATPRGTTRRAAAPSTKVRSTVDEMVVQADLATMDARDQWNRLMSEVDRRRSALETAMKRLASGGAEATRTMNDAVREAMVELREAVEGALAALR